MKLNKLISFVASAVHRIKPKFVPTPTLSTPLTFRALEDNSKIYISGTFLQADPYIWKYSTDSGTSWDTYSFGSEITLNKIDDEVLLSSNTPASVGLNNNSAMSISHLIYGSGKFQAYGNINSLVSFDNNTRLAQSCFSCLFQHMGSSLIDVEKILLPSVNVCFNSYCSLFSNCTSIEKSPTIPCVIQGGEYSHRDMFNGCSSLSSITCELSSFIFVDGPLTCVLTQDWVEGVASNGTFYCTTTLGTDSTITKDESHCPSGWTVQNI